MNSAEKFYEAVIKMENESSDYQRFFESLDVATAVGIYFYFYNLAVSEKPTEIVQALNNGIYTYCDLPFRGSFYSAIDGVFCAINEFLEITK